MLAGCSRSPPAPAARLPRHAPDARYRQAEARRQTASCKDVPDYAPLRPAAVRLAACKRSWDAGSLRMPDCEERRRQSCVKRSWAALLAPAVGAAPGVFGRGTRRRGSMPAAGEVPLCCVRRGDPGEICIRDPQTALCRREPAHAVLPERGMDLMPIPVLAELLYLPSDPGYPAAEGSVLPCGQKGGGEGCGTGLRCHRSPNPQFLYFAEWCPVYGTS